MDLFLVSYGFLFVDSDQFSFLAVFHFWLFLFSTLSVLHLDGCFLLDDPFFSYFVSFFFQFELLCFYYNRTGSKPLNWKLIES